MRSTRVALCALVLLSVFSLPSVALAGAEGSISDLAWMTGSWKGSTGNGTIEENWIRPDAGTIASLVRGTADGAMNMIELIVIEEHEGSLVLRLQQWNPGFEPRSENAQEMELVSVGENKVQFKATGEGGLTALGYSRPADDTFVIHVQYGDNKIDIPLKAQ